MAVVAEDKRLIKKTGLLDLCAQAALVRKSVADARDCFIEAERVIKRAVAMDSSPLPVFRFDEATQAINVSFWRHLVRITRADAFLSDKKLREFDASLGGYNHEVPEFNYENAAGMLNDLQMNAADLAKEAILDAYKLLRPSRSTRKSNQMAHVGEKWKRAILDYMIAPAYGGLRMSYSRKDILNRIEKGFSLLEGKGCKRYPDDMGSVADSNLHEGKTTFETEYFRVKCFSGGTLHLIFKRMDLVQRMEQIAAGNVLCGAN